MPNITEEKWIEMLEKKADGTYIAKYPKVKSKSGITFDEHLAKIATSTQLGHVKAGQNITIDSDGTINAKGGNVDSVNGKTGEVVIDVGDIAGLVSSRLALGWGASAAGNYSIALG